MRRFRLYYNISMIVYMLSSIFLIVLGIVIAPVANLYHENTREMISPVFGNFYNFMMGLAAAGTAILAVSIVFFALSMITASKASMKLSITTIVFPVILYIFALYLLVISI